MTVRSLVMAFALTLTLTTAAAAQSDVPGPGMEDGVVAQIDTAAGVFQLEDGRIYRVQPGTELVYKGYPTPLSSLHAGDYITITNAQRLAYRDGQYVLIPTN
jgi:hypothetical protein